MKHATDIYKKAWEVGRARLLQDNRDVLVDIESRLEAAAREGLTEIYEVFISHRIKHEIVAYLTEHGYHCFEDKVGNIFTISCDPTFKK